MNTQRLGVSSLVSSRLAYGCLRIASTLDPAEVTPERMAQGRQTVIAAYEAGYTSFDHADIYCRGVCETIFGPALKQVAGMRDRVLIATKCGIRFAGDPDAAHFYRYDSAPRHIISSCEQSLKRLGVETIDLYQLHRPDFLMEPTAVAEAFDTLKAQGKVREFGVSNFPPSTLACLQKSCPMPLIVNQVEVHLARLDCLQDGTLDQCLAENITPLAWSPLGGGVLADPTPATLNHRPSGPSAGLVPVLDEIANCHGVSRPVLCLAWLLRHPSRIIPIVGSANPQRIRDAAGADAVELSREDWYRILTAARGSRLP
jgi:predicted oxidoreductase